MNHQQKIRSYRDDVPNQYLSSTFLYTTQYVCPNTFYDTETQSKQDQKIRMKCSSARIKIELNFRLCRQQTIATITHTDLKKMKKNTQAIRSNVLHVSNTINGKLLQSQESFYWQFLM